MECPFCGYEDPKVSAKVIKWLRSFESIKIYRVICHSCYARGPTTKEGEEEAIELWNRRQC